MCDVYISLQERLSTKFHERLPNFVGSLSCIMKYGILLSPPFSAFSVVEMSYVMRISIFFQEKVDINVFQCKQVSMIFC